jgi:alpha-methylacyl-CoA racemase
LLKKLGLDAPAFRDQMDVAMWPALRAALTAVIATKSRDEWCVFLEGSDVCVAPVMNLDEAPQYAHNRARETFVEVAGVVQPSVAPRFSVTPGEIQAPPPAIGAHSEAALKDWGLPEDVIAALKNADAIYQS